MKPKIQQVLDEITYTWADLDVALVLSQFHPTPAGALKALLDARSVRTQDTLNGGGHLLWQQVTLTATTDRDKIAERLQLRVARDKDEWRQDIDRCFHDAYQRQMQVPDPLDLADVGIDSLEPPYLFAPVLLDGQVTSLLADQGSTKSYLMLYVACCTVTGRESIFGPPRREGPCIFYDWEQDKHVSRRRLELICRGLGIGIPRGLYYVDMSARGRLMDMAPEMRHQIARIKPVQVMVDSLTFATGGDLNSTEFSSPTMSAIGGLGEGVAKLVASHPTKASRKAPDEDVSIIGSGLFEFRGRGLWLLKAPPRHSRGSDFVVTMTDRKASEDEDRGKLYYRIAFDRDAHSVRFERATSADEMAQAATGVTGEEAIMQHLQRCGQDNTTRMAQVLRMTPGNVRSYCRRLRDKGLAQKIGGDEDTNTAVWTLRTA